MEVKHNLELKKYTTFKIGGPARTSYFPETKSEFVELLSALDSPLVLGSASNVIISSLGLDSDVIFTHKLDNFTIEGNKITALCGAKGPLLSKEAQQRGLCGFEFMIGFPGSLGGLIYMNASAHNQAISDRLISCEVFDSLKKTVITLAKSEMNFAYRSSILQKNNRLLLSADFELTSAEKEAIDLVMMRNLEFRKLRQPSLALPNIGSIFKNPENDTAGRLLDLAGAKSLSCGDACVWDQHANFIINTGSATSTDVLSLMLNMKSLVQEKYTINLRPEPGFVGIKTKEDKRIWDTLQNS